MRKMRDSASSRIWDTGCPWGLNAVVAISSLAEMSLRRTERSRTISAYRRTFEALGTLCARAFRYASPPQSSALPRLCKASNTVITSAGLLDAIKLPMAA